MFITYLCLYRCRRFSLKNTEKIEIRPSAKSQMVLGTNGAGKSSLLRIGFTVIPPSKNDFFPGGYRHTKVSHEGHHYELKSSFDGKPVHSFKRDDEELNKGGTESVQRELVEQHFGMTQDIHNLLTGEERFTSMSPIRRRDWITKLSSANFDYVLNLYNKAKKGLRDANAVVKHNQGRLAAETAKLRTNDEIIELQKRSVELRDELADLMSQSKPELAQRGALYANDFNAKYEQLCSLSKDAANVLLYSPQATSFADMEDVEQRVDQERGKVRELEGMLHSLSEEFEYVDIQMRKLASIEGKDELTLKQQKTEHETRRRELVEKLVTGLHIEEISYSTKDQHDIEAFTRLSREIPVQTHEQYTNEEVDRHRQLVTDHEQRLATTDQKLWSIEGRLEHIGNCQSLNCPSCGHLFKPGIGDEDETKLADALKRGQQHRNELIGSLDTSKKYLVDYEIYRRALQGLYSFRQSHPNLSGLWKLIDLSGGLTDGFKVIDCCQRYRRDGQVVIQIKEIDEHLIVINESLAEIESLGGQSEGIRERYQQLEDRIRKNTEAIRETKWRVAQYSQYLQAQRDFDRRDGELTRLIGELETISQNIVEGFYQHEVMQLIKQRQVSLAMIEQTLTEAEVQQGIVNDIQHEIDTMSVQEKAFKALMETLSPSDGLIAEQISVFINALIDRMNLVIDRIWGYNLVIKPCDISDGDLDYRFPMYAVKDDNTVPDVSKGSTSQVDIVNQAFRLIVYKFLHLDGYPLYLDELGASFDEVHRHNLVPAIKDLIEDDSFSQVFIISHYADGQGSYTNAQLIVLDDSHLNLKQAYNEHVNIE